MEHFCTLFDINFLPQGLALYNSLNRSTQQFVLWILCMDTPVEEALLRLNLSKARIIPLREIETKELLAVKPGRSRAEYCWTMTPFLPSAVIDRDPSVQRVTYVDADCWFFNDPELILHEMDMSGKDVMITPHDYLPQYDQTNTSGIFCVQFMPFRKTEPGLKVLKWWQTRCLEWCFAKVEPSRFGDQKYLDSWAQLFGDAVHVQKSTHFTMAPWNALRYADILDLRKYSCMYHFHGLRIYQNMQICLNTHYRLPYNIKFQLYAPYLDDLKRSFETMNGIGLTVEYPPSPYKGIFTQFKRLHKKFIKNESWTTMHF